MEATPTPEQAILALYIWVLLLGGLIALVRALRADTQSKPMTLRPWNLSWLDFGLYCWVLVMFSFAAQVALAFLMKNCGVPEDDIPAQMLGQGVAFHVVALSLVLFAFHKARDGLQLSPERLGLRNLFGMIVGCFFSGIFLAMLLGKSWEFLLSFLSELGLASPPEPQEMVAILSEAGIGWTTISLAVLAVFIAPVSEELMFRAGLYRFLKGRLSARFALIVSSLLFALMHFNTLSFLPLLLIGMLLCRAYERSGNILVPIGFHALFNANNIALLVLIGPFTES